VIASEFEYRHRFAIVAFVFVFAYAFYNLDPLNIVYAIVPRDLGVLSVKRCGGWSRRMETAFANIAGVFLGSYPHFAPALRRMASCHAGAKPSGMRHSNGAWWLHWPPLPAR